MYLAFLFCLACLLCSLVLSDSCVYTSTIPPRVCSDLRRGLSALVGVVACSLLARATTLDEAASATLLLVLSIVMAVARLRILAR